MKDFKKSIWDFYATQKRDMPWRHPAADGSFDPYAIWISEIMLQQTQVGRVIPKFTSFMQHFPTVQALAAAPLSDVLRLWSGLGYNRRAKFIHQAAKYVMQERNGDFPRTLDELVQLPGIGVNTAGAIMAYAYNQPVVFIETNIRSVLICHFFPSVDKVAEADLRRLALEALDTGRPREWYWALMDYGAHLKATAGNHARRAAVYSRQSAFHGSVRQVRGQVLRRLLQGPASRKQLSADIPDDRLSDVLDRLVQEALICWTDGNYSLPSS